MSPSLSWEVFCIPSVKESRGMKKLLRYWWVLVIGLVVLPPVAAAAVISVLWSGPKYVTRWEWVPLRAFRVGWEPVVPCLGVCPESNLYLGFIVASKWFRPPGSIRP
jgi:hypothetical protein